jgi:subtilisin family serine protease
MNKRHHLARILLLLLVAGTHVVAQNRWIVRMNSSGAKSVQQASGGSWAPLYAPEGVYSVTGPSSIGQALQLLKNNPLVQSVEADAPVTLPETDAGYNPSGHQVPALVTSGSFNIPAPIAAPWGPYLNQPANSIVKLQQAQQAFGYGGGLVAIIDTGVDYSHPVLFPVVNFWQGADFTGSNDVTGNSDLTQETSPVVDQETSPVVDQETSPVVDSGGTIILNQETSPVVDQETSPVVDGTMPPDFGHGTMVAGIVHLVAPWARILPVKAFNSNGRGSLSSVVAAIYYAVQQGATVINMSFGGPQDSPALEAAIAYAGKQGVTCVAAVANTSSPAVQYPAAEPGVIGVASTTNQDQKSLFSSWGTDVDIAAPGEAIVTTFPFNRYALGWGTSFATPYVSGTVALLESIKPNTNIVKDLNKGADPVYGLVSGQTLGAGRLDIYQSGAKAQ